MPMQGPKCSAHTSAVWKENEAEPLPDVFMVLLLTSTYRPVRKRPLLTPTEKLSEKLALHISAPDCQSRYCTRSRSILPATEVQNRMPRPWTPYAALEIGAVTILIQPTRLTTGPQPPVAAASEWTTRWPRRRRVYCLLPHRHHAHVQLHALPTIQVPFRHPRAKPRPARSARTRVRKHQGQARPRI